MPTIDSKTLSVRMSNQLAAQVQKKADEQGTTVNAYLTSLAMASVKGYELTPEPEKEEQEEAHELSGEQSVLYGVALNLVDDLVRAGYPESDIRGALTNIRRELL